jgi:hypothetical protein
MIWEQALLYQQMGVGVSFIEDIPLDQRVSDDLYRWVLAKTLDDCESPFR